jgi:hypothetical protein
VQVAAQKWHKFVHTGLLLHSTGHDCEIRASTTTAKGAIGKENCGVACNLMAKQALAPAMARAIDWCRDHNNGGTEIDGAAGINVYELARVAESAISRGSKVHSLCGQGKPAIINALSLSLSLSRRHKHLSARRFTEAKQTRQLRNRANLIRTGVFTSALRHTPLGSKFKAH